MKKMKKLNVILFALLMVFFTSCGDDDTDSIDDVDGVGSGTITASVDGTQVEFENITGAKAGVIAIGGEKGDMIFSMLLAGDIKEGTYSGDDLPAMTYTPDNGETGLLAMSGSLTITKHDEASNVIEGTFDVGFSNWGYEGDDIMVNGSFKVEYVDAGF